MTGPAPAPRYAPAPRELAFTESTDGILIVDAAQPRLLIVDVNPAFELITGYARDEIIGQTYEILQGPGPDHLAVARLLRALAAGDVVTETLLTYRKDGTPF